LFNDSDFENDQVKEKKEKPVTYKDMLRKEGMGEESESEDNEREKKKETIMAEQKRLKNEFL